MPFALIEILSAVLSLIAGGLFGSDVVRNLLRKWFDVGTEPQTESYAEKISRLTSKLQEASDEVDQVLGELATVARNREASVLKLEAELGDLQSREKELQDRISHLQNVPLPVAEHFAKLTAAGEKKSAMRDYSLFGGGVVVSTVIAILLKYFGLA